MSKKIALDFCSQISLLERETSDRKQLRDKVWPGNKSLSKGNNRVGWHLLLKTLKQNEMSFLLNASTFLNASLAAPLGKFIETDG